jgi:hypothetical protein
MLVPSLSWQNDRFMYINWSKGAFFAGEPGEEVEIAVVVPSATADAAGAREGGMIGPLSGKVRVVRVEVGPSGQSAVKCSAAKNNGCQVV